MAGYALHGGLGQLKQAGGRRLPGKLVHPFDDLRQHQVDVLADDGAVDEVHRLAAIEQEDGAAIRARERQHMGAHLLARPGQLGEAERELVIRRGDRRQHGPRAQCLQIGDVEGAIAGAADHQLGAAESLGLVHQLEAVGERLHLAQGIRLHQLQMQVAAAQLAGDAAPHLAIAKQGGLADIEGAPQGARQRLGGVDHTQADLDVFRLLEGAARHRDDGSGQHLLLVALMAIFGHLHHPEKARAEMFGENRLGLGEIATYVQDDETLMGFHQGGYLGNDALGIRGPVAIERQHWVVLLGPGKGRPVHGLRFGQDGADAPHPIEHLDELGPVGKQVSHQQDAEIPEASLLGEMAKKQMLRSLTVQLWPP